MHTLQLSQPHVLPFSVNFGTKNVFRIKTTYSMDGWLRFNGILSTQVAATHILLFGLAN